ncbi:MAG: hypothetical protein K8I04_06830 [Gammaproteobacteria bacterium]|nr:hypothetical protein [Gammaproteobacteria bacterium]
MSIDPIALRLDSDTLAALDAMPGATRSDRMRHAIMSSVVTAHVAQQVADISTQISDLVAVTRDLRERLDTVAHDAAQAKKGMSLIYKHLNVGGAKPQP